MFGEEVDAVAGVDQRRRDLGADDVAADDRIVEQVVDRELAHVVLAVGAEQSSIEGDRRVRSDRLDGLEHLRAIVLVDEGDERPVADQLRIVTEQAW